MTDDAADLDFGIYRIMHDSTIHQDGVGISACGESSHRPYNAQTHVNNQKKQ